MIIRLGLCVRGFDSCVKGVGQPVKPQGLYSNGRNPNPELRLVAGVLTAKVGMAVMRCGGSGGRVSYLYPNASVSNVSSGMKLSPRVG